MLAWTFPFAKKKVQNYSIVFHFKGTNTLIWPIVSINPIWTTLEKKKNTHLVLLPTGYVNPTRRFLPLAPNMVKIHTHNLWIILI